MSTKKAPHPSGDVIIFEEFRHSYKSLKFPKIFFTSGTGFLKKFFEPFDKEGISKNYAKKHGMTQEEVLAKWERKGTIGREMGTLVHSFIEDSLDPKKPTPKVEEIIHEDAEILEAAQVKARVAEQVVVMIQDQFEIVGFEAIIASHDWALAGMIDLRAISKLTGNPALIDWKTNGSISFSGFRGQTALPPIAHLEDCDFIKYALQLNLYEGICRKEGYLDDPDQPVDKHIVHIQEDDYDFLPAPDFQPEIQDMVVRFKDIREAERKAYFAKRGWNYKKPAA